MTYWVFNEAQLDEALEAYGQQARGAGGSAQRALDEVALIRDFLYANIARERGLRRGADEEHEHGA